MSKRSPSRQARKERRAHERMQRKMESKALRLDPTKWLGYIGHPDTGEIVRIPRIVPEVGSMWRCDLYDVKFLVRQVNDDRIVGQVWNSNRQLSTVLERFRNSRLIENFAQKCGKDIHELLDRLRVDLPRLFNDNRAVTGELQVSTLDFCGLDILVDHSLQEIVMGLGQGRPPENDRYHFRPIS